jgi:tRNA threonylcarbamoyladenosine biosynthesis protein TsaB
VSALLTLAIDASTYAGSVAVLRGDVPLAVREVAMRGRDAERLMPAVAGALGDAGVAPRGVGRVVCGGGPGSFTSLRIAGAIAKGIALAADRPLFDVPSLLLMAAGRDPAPPPGRYLAVLDAMRGEVYAAEVEVPHGGGDWRIGETRLLAAGDVDAAASALAATPLGAGRRVEAVPHARGVARLGAWLAARRPVDLAAWEPAYGRLAEAQVKWEAAHGRALPGG